MIRGMPLPAHLDQLDADELPRLLIESQAKIDKLTYELVRTSCNAMAGKFPTDRVDLQRHQCPLGQDANSVPSWTRIPEQPGE